VLTAMTGAAAVVLTLTSSLGVAHALAPDGTMAARWSVAPGGNPMGSAVVQVPGGPVVTGGSFTGTSNFGLGAVTAPTGGPASAYLAAYDPASGSAAWVQTVNSAYVDSMAASSTDVYAAGSYSGRPAKSVPAEPVTAA
jgi:hypothetical protein